MMAARPWPLPPLWHLSRMFGVTERTVRRDLAALRDEGIRAAWRPR
jgi:DNA-binding GntR family transcriptional regulator